MLLQLPDGSRVLRLQALGTSDGPQLEVWLTDAPVIGGRAGRHVFDDGAHVELGELEGNIGSSNHRVLADADLDALTSVSIRCDRFDVTSAAAELRPVARTARPVRGDGGAVGRGAPRYPRPRD